MTTPVTRVPTIYGGHYYVPTADLANERITYLPLFTRDGRRWADTQAGQRAARNHHALHIHRDNIGPKQTDAEHEAAVKAIFAAAGL